MLAGCLAGAALARAAGLLTVADVARGARAGVTVPARTRAATHAGALPRRTAGRARHSWTSDFIKFCINTNRTSGTFLYVALF